MRRLILFVLLTAGFSVLAAGPGTESPNDEALAGKLGTDEYVLAFLRAGPSRDQDFDTAASLQEAHLENITRLSEAGKLVLTGPFLDVSGVVKARNSGEVRRPIRPTNSVCWSSAASRTASPPLRGPRRGSLTRPRTSANRDDRPNWTTGLDHDASLTWLRPQDLGGTLPINHNKPTLFISFARVSIPINILDDGDPRNLHLRRENHRGSHETHGIRSGHSSRKVGHGTAPVVRIGGLEAQRITQEAAEKEFLGL